MLPSQGGESGAIDTTLSTQTIRDLKDGTAADRDKIIAKIEQEPDQYIPPVLYLISSFLFEEGKRDDAAFWFYAGQLRARYDANRCTNETAESAVRSLNHEFGGPINRYEISDPSKLETLIAKVVDWDRKTPHNYDQRWINLHCKIASNDKALSVPRDQWNSIEERTRQEFQQQFESAVQKAQQSNR
jgi:hypothetical protein